MEKAAVFYDKDKKMAEFYQCSGYSIFGLEQDELKEIGEAVFEPVAPSSPAAIRARVNELIAGLGDCKTAAFGNISGIPYSAFDMAGFCIFQLGDNTREGIKGLLKDLQQFKEKQSKASQAKVAPEETDVEGVYRFDLIKAQEANPELSSKKALLPFFELTPFMELELTCAHIPPWLERDERFLIRVEKAVAGQLVLITHRQCEGG
ncbi:Fe-only nitrogenase accessory AnfO family protein [Anaerocolumna xylanovorans]|uniref:Iron only nitrogenase protein AnfO (AnfO_nitrog) n=1 Tax=Anaerocolumna xylanovorans DSM 12503 TaxID=1121345 RepID=A0A1M7YHP6_9FIRM|nr:Fe-only nitrogenase accessory AnfO family protein [Anaerocolumna xylanovorans]SHO52175.1 Iron only nitrogenase protein AnfO (AnfO_nitrog) [Anaerocolumna xylanovorans DSM 12503]